MRPDLRSCMLSPAMAAAQHTAAPTRMAVAAALVAATPPTAKSIGVPSSTSRISDIVRIVAIVTPEIGLLDETTSPAIYPATDENGNPAINEKMSAMPIVLM